MGHRAHERPVRVADVAVDHLEVALVDRQVRGLAQRAATVVEGRARVGQLHEVAKVLDRRVAPAVVEVVDERRPVGRHEHHVRVADDDAACRVPRRLGEARRRGGLDDLPAHPALEADPGALDVGTGRTEDLDRLREVDDLDPDLLEQRVGVVLDRLEALGRDHLHGRQRPGQVGEGLHRPRESGGLARGPAASRGRRRDRAPVSPSSTPWYAPLRVAARARGPRRTRGWHAAAPRSRRSPRTGCPRSVSSVARVVSRCGRLGDDEGLGSDRLGHPGERRADVRGSSVPAQHDRVRAHRPAGSRESPAERHVGGAVEQPAADDRCRRDDRDVRGLPPRWTGRCRDRASRRGRRGRGPRPATVAAPDRTSWTETASDRSAPGRLSTSGSARWKPVPGGRAPVARTTTSAPTAVDRRGVRRRP